jgi:S1-C subfamily serine protease
MGGRGPFNFGDLPDDPDESAPDDDVLKPPWLPPEDRLWRHPSEIARHGQPAGALGSALSVPVGAHRRERRFAVTVGVAGAAAVVTAVVAVAAFTLTDSQGATNTPRSASGASDATLVTVPIVTGISAPVVVRMVAALRPSLIAISPIVGSPAAHMTGIVLPGGDLAVTAAAAVGKASRVEIVTSSGQHRWVRVLGRDAHSGIAVVSTGGGLTPANFADGDVEPGELTIAACLCGSAAVAAAADFPAAVAVGEIRKVGASVTLSSGTDLVDTIEADMPLGPAPWGGVLLDGRGQVVGVLDARTTTVTGRTGLFVPATLAVGVARELASSHKVEHGWLGIKCTDMPNDGGARITAIMAGSPAAAAGLHQGDVVEAVDLQRVNSLADLQASLYTSPPGTSVSLLLDRSGQDVVTTMTLAGSPTG